jgi:CDP-diacylglycerol--serine O-phosphatidyltransferase
MILGAYNRACWLTLSGLLAALGACVLSTVGEIELALIGLMLAGLADLFDGVVARSIERSEYEKEFGVQLDTVVDVVAFVVTPFVIAFNYGLRSLPALAVMMAFVVAGLIRLAHFNTMSAQGTGVPTHHRGVPVTYTALVFPLLFVATAFVAPSTFRWLLGVTFPAFAVLFVMDVPVRKPRGVFYVVFPLLGVVLIAYWLWRFAIRG